ncbi:hypothetical protein WJX82_000386 [Trebouxia sp. C0006]
MILSAFAGVVAWALLSQLRRTSRYDLKRIPGPTTVPLVGNLGAVIGSSYVRKVLAKWTNEYGSVFKWSLIGKDILVITDPEEVYKLCSREANLPKAWALYKGLNTRAPHNNILATPDNEEWKYMRKMTNPAFSPENIRKAYPQILGAACKATEVLKKTSIAGLVDVSDLSARVTAEIINSLAALPMLQTSKEQQDDIALTFTNPFYALLLVVWPWHPRAKRFQHNQATVWKRGVQPEANTSLWACLGRFVNYKDGSPIPSATIATNAGLFFGAGYETTAHAITWALFELAAEPSIQARVRKELSEAGLVATPDQPTPRKPDFADLSKLKVLEAVIKETLRLHVTAPLGSVREADRDMVIKGYRVPKGVTLMLSPHPMHVSHDNYLHPDKFWPERWISDTVTKGDSKHSAHPDATTKGNRRNISASWNPFSTGPRNCIGQTLALAELRTVLAVMIGNFFFKLPEGVQREKFIDEEEVWWVTLQAKHGLPLKVTPITAVQA